MAAESLAADAADAAGALARSAAARAWTGPDPYDGLWWRWPRPLTAGPRRRQAITQAHARSPLDLRALRRAPRPRLAKALAVFATVELRLLALGRGSESAARAPLDLLLADPGAARGGWGYPFAVQTRWSHYPAGAPNAVVTAFAGSALAEAERALGAPEYGDAARRSAARTLETLFRPRTRHFAYHAYSDAVIHNASLLAARFVHGALPGDGEARSAVRVAVRCALEAQQPDGSWPYGDGPGLGFVDGYHTAYVLASLADLHDVEPAIVPALERGQAYYARELLRADGGARLYAGADHPEDAHSAGSALTALTKLSALGLPEAGVLADRVARRALKAIVRGDRTIHRRHRRLTNRISYLRWAEAHVALGLADHAVSGHAGG